jgi:alpha-glucosidase (family GH31 glycosyl hydrolase)
MRGRYTLLVIGILLVAIQLGLVQAARQGGPRGGRTITLGEVTSFDAKDNVFTIAAGSDLVRLMFYRDDIFRIWVGPDGEFTDAQPDAKDAQMVVFSGAPMAALWRDAGDYYRVQTRECVLRVYKKPLRFALFDNDNASVVWQETKPISYGPTSTQTLRRGETENFYGGGMQNGYFSHRDTSVSIRLNTRGWGDGTTPNPAPFYMSTAGYGVFRHTMAPGRYDFLQPVALAHDERRFDAYYFYGPSLKKILDGYTLVTGRPFFPPRWGLEWGDADCYNKKGKTSDVVEKVASQYRLHDMPAGWILPNDGYGCGYQDLDQTIVELGKLGFYTGLWTERGLDRIAHEVSVSGTRVMKLDVAWVGPGYQFALNGMRDAYEGIEKNSDARGFVWTTCAWAGGQRYSTIWSGDQSGNWEYIRFHIPSVIGAGLSGFNAATGDVDGIFGGSALTQVRDIEWKAFTPVWMIISGWSKQTNLMKQPWIFGEPYTTINRKYMTLKMRLTPYLYTYSREAYDTGVPTVRAMVLEFPDDAATWSKRTQYQFMSGEWLLVAPVYEDSPIRNDIYLPSGKWVDYWDGREYNGPTTVNGYETPLDRIPLFVKAGAIIPMYPPMLYDRQKPKDPVTVDVYPFGRTSFSMYEDDGTTQSYSSGAFTRTLIEVDAPKSLDEAGAQVTVKVGAARGSYKEMPASRPYVVELHVPAKPASVRLGDRVLQMFQLPAGDRAAREKARAEFDAAPEGWLFDPSDRRGVLHVRIKPQAVSAGYVVKVTM